MRLNISHRTVYTYEQPVTFLPHLLYLRPRETPLLRVENFTFTFSPEANLSWMRDDMGNMPVSARFFLDSSKLDIHFECVVTTSDNGPFDFLVRDSARTMPFQYEPLHRFNLSNYLMLPFDETQKGLKKWMDDRFIYRPADTIAWIFALNQTVFQSIRNVRRDEPGIQPSLETIQLGSGSCRDLAVLLVECARIQGLAARFVSGYLYDPNLNQNESGDMHAWADIYIPGAGWRGIDPSRGIFCTNAYIPVSHAIVADSINPVQGSFTCPEPVTAKLHVDVRVSEQETAFAKARA